MSSVEERFHWDAEVDHPDGVDARVWSPDHDGDGVELCLSLIEPYLPSAGTVLDLGCGVGRLLFPLARRHPELHFEGLDISPRMLEEAAWRGGDLPNVTLLLGDGRTLAGTPLVLAGAYSVVTLQHIPDEAVRDYLMQLGRRIGPSGVFRFQICLGDENVPYSHCRDLATIHWWCREAGFNLDAQMGIGDPVWAWCTAR